MSRQKPGLTITNAIKYQLNYELRGRNTDAEIWLLTESLIELLAYKVETHTLSALESSLLSVEESDKVNELLGVLFKKAQTAHMHLDGQALVNVNEGRQGLKQHLHSVQVSP